MNKTLVIKVGGSMLSLSEDEIFSFGNSTKLKDTLEALDNEYKFLLCVGGGYLARKFQKLLINNGYEKAWQHEVGVAAININAVMLHSVLGGAAEDTVLRYEDYDSETPLNFEKRFFVTAAGKPGHSSDWNTVKLAIRIGSKQIISLKNVDGVYTADPKKDQTAKRLDNLTWSDYLDIIGNPVEHIPGANYPVDPFASKLARDNGIEFFIIDGLNFENLAKLIGNEEYIGTKIY